MILKSAADTLWSRRLFKVKRATGWNLDRLGQEMGSSVITIQRIFKGRRPTLPVILKIKALETKCAADLKALDEGWIQIDRWGKRIDFRDDRRSRPRDLADLGDSMGLADGRR